VVDDNPDAVADHTSVLALIEKRFLDSQPLTQRDAHADTLEDLFDFSGRPSQQALVWPSLAPRRLRLAHRKPFATWPATGCGRATCVPAALGATSCFSLGIGPCIEY